MTHRMTYRHRLVRMARLLGAGQAGAALIVVAAVLILLAALWISIRLSFPPTEAPGLPVPPAALLGRDG